MIGLSGEPHGQTSDLLPLGDRRAEWTIVSDRSANIPRTAAGYGQGIAPWHAKPDTPSVAALYPRFACHKTGVKERALAWLPDAMRFRPLSDEPGTLTGDEETADAGDADDGTAAVETGFGSDVDEIAEAA